MLQLKNITKNYQVGSELTVHALKGFSLNFRRSEFVSVLGPSGCGKTTLLNVIGGLDRYSSGDLIIDGKSTKGFADGDWDNYRNKQIGFVFQSYNLIPHITVLDNVALSLTFAGVGKVERLRRAKEALVRVGLGEQLKKLPNQLSGGQMQRVAIARAIVGDPRIVLADEPTGALDTETGVQVMELLKEISRDRLVILVTHNTELADRYSTRVVKLLDGELVSDSDPYTDEQLAADMRSTEEASTATVAEGGKRKRRRGGFWASVAMAFSISFRNLGSKRGRTFLTCFAGSIGIFGIALVLAISGGMSDYVDYMQTGAVGDTAVTIGETAYDVNRILSIMGDMEGFGVTEYPDKQAVAPYQREAFHTTTVLTEDFVNHLNQMDSSWYRAINYSYSINMHVLQNGKLLSGWSASQMVDNDSIVEDNYDVLYKAEGTTGYPQNELEMCLVVDKYNRISPSTLTSIGINVTSHVDENGKTVYDEVPFQTILDSGHYTVVLNNGWYIHNEDKDTYEEIKASQYGSISEENKREVRIVGILRRSKSSNTEWLSSGLCYLPSFAEFMVNNAATSDVGMAQTASKDRNVCTGNKFATMPEDTGTEQQRQEFVTSQYNLALQRLGAFKIPHTVRIIPSSINAKKQITDYLDLWNKNNPDSQVYYLDLTGLALSMMATFIDVVSWVLVAFSAVSLIVSTVMISVITYTSVVERTKEIGILRSIGASKRNISAIFNAESAVVGTFAGLLGVGIALVCGAAVNLVLGKLFNVTGIADFTLWIVLGMFALSVALTVCAGLIPAGIAAKRDPVKCLRTE